MEALGGKRDLGVHSLLVEHMLPLVEAGVITNARKRLHPGRMDVGEIMGTAALFDWAHDNPRDQHGAVGRASTIRRWSARSGTSCR